MQVSWFCPPSPTWTLLGRRPPLSLATVFAANMLVPRFYRARPTRETGVTAAPVARSQVVVSLTSYPRRFSTLWLAIESLLRQTVKPNRIVLWLAEKECDGHPLPDTVLSQRERGLEIRYCQENLRPFNKLYHALNAFPDSLIITVDDDIVYREDLVATLLGSYERHPSCVSGMTTHRIVATSEGRFGPYTSWPVTTPSDQRPSHALFATGVNGVLYPPGCLHPDAMDAALYRRLSLTNDDLWLKIMAFRAGTKVVMAEQRAHYLAWVYGSQETRLTDVDVFGGQNDVIWERLSRRFQIHPSDMLGEE